MTRLHALAAMALAAALATTSAPAETDPVVARGAAEYRDACAVCHGRDARGDGTMATLLRVAPPDLTTLSERNDGEFPYERVFAIIDGRVVVEGHGGADMPIWGRTFRREEETTAPFLRYNPEILVAGRIHALVRYLNAIQGGAEVSLPAAPETQRRSWPEDIPRPKPR